MKDCEKDNNQLESFSTKVIFGMPKKAKFNVISWMHDKYMKFRLILNKTAQFHLQDHGGSKHLGGLWSAQDSFRGGTQNIGRYT